MRAGVAAPLAIGPPVAGPPREGPHKPPRRRRDNRRTARAPSEAIAEAEAPMGFTRARSSAIDAP
jgi:hypothetical protein